MLTPLPAPVSVSLADPTSGPVTARYTTTLPCPAVPSVFLTGFHVPSFSKNLVGVRSLVSSHVGVWIEPPGETAVCVDQDTYAPLATFTAEPGSGLYTLHTGPRGQQQQQPQLQQQELLPPTTVTAPRQVPPSHQVAVSHRVAVSGQVPVCGLAAMSCSCRSLAHPSIPRLHAMSIRHLVLGLPRVLLSLPPSLVPPCGPCVEGRLRATPHSSSLRPATEPFETLHLDVWGPAARPGPERESFFLVVVDDYSRYTTVFPLAKKSQVTSTLIWWLLTTVDTRGRRVSCLHSDRGGEFCSGVLARFCHEQGIRQSWTIPESPQQNGVAERHIGLVMEIAHTSLTHARAPHFLWPYADSSDFTFYHPHLHRFFFSCDVRFDESVPYYVRYPFRGLPIPPPPLFLTSAPPPSPPVQPLPPGPAPSGVSHATPPPSVAPQVQPPSPQSSSQPTADPAGSGVCGKDPGGASSGGVGVGFESVPMRGHGSGGAGVEVEPVPAGASSPRGAGVSRAVPGGATNEGAGAPTAGIGESRTGRVAAGGADSGGGAAGVGARGERVGATAAGATAAVGAAAAVTAGATAAAAAAAATAAAGAAGEVAAAATSASYLWSSDPRSPLAFSYPLPSLPVYGPTFPPPDYAPAVFRRSQPPLSPPLSHAWTSCSPHARPSSPVPLTDLRTIQFHPSPPRSTLSVLPSPPESALTASLSTPVTDYYHVFCPVLSHVLASLVTDPRASLSSVSTLTVAVTEFASTRRLDYATSLVAAPPTSPLAVGGESALGCDALEDRQFELEFLAAASPHLYPSSADPSLFVRRGSTPFFATTDRVALADMKRELQKRHTCTDLGELRHYLGLHITRDRAARTITLSQSHMVQQVLQWFELQHSTIERTPLAIDHRLTGPFPDEPFEPSGPYAELVGCLMYLITCTRLDLAFPLSILARFVAPGRHLPVHWISAMRVAKYLAMTSGVGLVLGGRQSVVLTGHCDSSYADDAETHKST
ncbi:unnamed protein product [Closterium sp. NIES-54]